MILAAEYERGLHAGKYMTDEERRIVAAALRMYGRSVLALDPADQVAGDALSGNV